MSSKLLIAAVAGLTLLQQVTCDLKVSDAATVCDGAGARCLKVPENCNFSGDSTTCKLFVAYTAGEKDATDFYAYSNLNRQFENSYVAVGFSPKGAMEGSSIVSCLIGDGGKLVVQLANVPQAHEYKPLLNWRENKQLIVGKSDSSVVNGAVLCRFSLALRSKGNDTFVDIEKQPFLIAAGGIVDNPKDPNAIAPKQHNSKSRFAQTTQISLAAAPGKPDKLVDQKSGAATVSACISLLLTAFVAALLR